MPERFDTFSPPPPRPDPWESAQATGGSTQGNEELDPREASSLLTQALRRAESQFDLRPPIVLLAAAVTVLVVYGAAWLSVRHQHPYSGPSGTALGVLYGMLALWIVFVSIFMRRALRGRSSRQRRIEGWVFAGIWICVYVFQGALHHAGANAGIAYGIYPAIAPLLIVGSAAAAYESARGNVGRGVFALAAVVLAAVAAFAGPATVWAVMGIGLCTLVLAGAALQFAQRRARA